MQRVPNRVFGLINQVLAEIPILQKIGIDLGGITTQFQVKEAEIPLQIAPFYQAFSYHGKPDFILNVTRSPFYGPDLHNPKFTSTSWSYYQQDGRKIFKIQIPDLDGSPHSYLLEFFAKKQPPCLHVLLAETPVIIPPFGADALITAQLLSTGYGITLHACGIKVGEHGMLFSGVSGSGKSTTAGLWLKHGGSETTLLSDERVTLREQAGQYSIHGTPWHGKNYIPTNDSAPLERIMILRHGPDNILRLLQPAEAVKLLLQRAYLPYWDSEAMAFSLDLLHRLCQVIPCYDFGFTPDVRAVEAVWRQIDS